jgi:transposase InsO family protein
LAELQADYRQHFRATHRLLQEELTWHVPGTVWAMDHSWPPGLIDGIRAEALAVRDLGSGAQLAWQAVPDETAFTTAAVLASLIWQHGPPLVIKSDNGSAFKSEELRYLLAEHRIVWLPSPPRMPWYNGGCEAGNGTMKVHTNTMAYLAGDLGRWTSKLMEAARRQANQSTYSRGQPGSTHADRWAGRPGITERERDWLETTIRTHQREIIEKMDEFDPQNRNHKHKVLRQAVRRALLDTGLLTINRRSITPPLKRQNWAKIC